MAHVTDKPFVLAISPFDTPWSHLAQHGPIEAALHGDYVDESDSMVGNDKHTIIRGYHIDRMYKDNGSAIELGIFNDPQYSFISAVIFSSNARFGKLLCMSNDPTPTHNIIAYTLNMTGTMPNVVDANNVNYTENLLDGLRVYHNHNARVKLDTDKFPHKSIFQRYFSDRDNDWVFQQYEGQLLFRTCQLMQL